MWQFSRLPRKCRVKQKVRNSSVLYHKTKNPFGVKSCRNISFLLLWQLKQILGELIILYFWVLVTDVMWKLRIDIIHKMNLVFFLLILFAPPRTIDWVILGSARAQTKRLENKVTTYRLVMASSNINQTFYFIHLCNIFHVKALDFFNSRSLITRLNQITRLKLSFVLIYHFNIDRIIRYSW